jgi:formylglycine-generating enzyme required for sulfatase activity/S1-C subfamily serine protease
LPVSRIFISHSSIDNAPAIALRDWLVGEGWDDLFLDLDPQRGIAAGERWERALNEAARRCEAVLFLISKAWLGSAWCKNELNLARRLNKRLFGILIEEGLAIGDLPPDVTSKWQVINLAAGSDHKQFPVALPVTGELATPTFSREGLARLKSGMQRAGLAASWFAWPPEHDSNRSPYRGLKPLEADDAGIFFGREAPTIEAIDRLRGMTEAAPPRLLVILGASGAGKSSFLRAGLLPRLGREDRAFLPLPVIRPERSAITGETGLLRALEGASAMAGLRIPRAALRATIDSGSAKLKPILSALTETGIPIAIEGEAERKPPIIVIAIDQAEELFLAEAQGEAKQFLTLLRDLLTNDPPALVTVFTIRSDNYERLQTAVELEGVHQEIINLPPMPRGSYAEVIKGPTRRLEGAARALRIDDALVQELLTDTDQGGAKDALPLLAFTLERLYEEYNATGRLTVDHYETLGRISGSIEAAIERAFKVADSDVRIPKDRQARLTLLRRGLIPWLAGIDPDTKAPRRRVARLSEIPAEARPLIDLLVEQRLLSTDVAKDTKEVTVEPAHEALLRQWGLLQGWLAEDAGLLTVLEGIKRGARDWAANTKAASWLAHSADRLRAAERLLSRSDLAANLEPTDKDYIAACQRTEISARWRARRAKVLVGALAACIMAVSGLGYSGFFDPSYRNIQIRKYIDIYIPRALTAEQERLLTPGDKFQECASCPEMVVVPAGEFMMGSADPGTRDKPAHKVTIAKPFAIGRFSVTFDQWDGCVAHGGCTYDPVDQRWGRATRPVINVSWEHAQQYVAWLSKQTDKTYRLLTEAEWEYAARAGSTTRYPWGDMIGEGNANCGGCGSEWDRKQTAPVGSFKPNAIGLYDMHGNVWQWVEDCYNENYEAAPADGTPANCKDESQRVLRGGSWGDAPGNLRSAARTGIISGNRNSYIGFRVGRTLTRVPSALQSLPNRSEPERAWEFIKETEDQARLEEFINRFGGTRYADIARARLEELKKQQIAVLPANAPGPAPQVTGSVPFDVKKIEASVYKIYTMRKKTIGTGTGFLVNGQRILVTTFHVVADGEKYFLGYRDGKQGKVVEARVVERRSTVDLAILEAYEDLPGRALALADFEPKKLANVVAMGSPGAADVKQEPTIHNLPELYAFMREPSGFDWTLTPGVVSRIYSATNTALSETQIINARMVQHNAPIGPGSSGGPLFDECGTVVGVNSFSPKGAQGHFFSIHSGQVIRFLRELNISYIATSALTCKAHEEAARRQAEGEQSDSQASERFASTFLSAEERVTFVKRIQEVLKQSKCYEGAINGSSNDSQKSLDWYVMSARQHGRDKPARIELAKATASDFDSWLREADDIKGVVCVAPQRDSKE